MVRGEFVPICLICKKEFVPGSANIKGLKGKKDKAYKKICRDCLIRNMEYSKNENNNQFIESIMKNKKVIKKKAVHDTDGMHICSDNK